MKLDIPTIVLAAGLSAACKKTAPVAEDVTPPTAEIPALPLEVVRSSRRAVCSLLRSGYHLETTQNPDLSTLPQAIRFVENYQHCPSRLSSNYCATYLPPVREALLNDLRQSQLGGDPLDIMSTTCGRYTDHPTTPSHTRAVHARDRATCACYQAELMQQSLTAPVSRASALMTLTTSSRCGRPNNTIGSTLARAMNAARPDTTVDEVIRITCATLPQD